MPVTEQILEIKNSLVDQDRKKAMEVLTRFLYYKIAPRISAGDSFAVFEGEGEIIEFCKNNNIDRRALAWLIEAMRAEELVTSSPMPIMLTPFGVEKLCQEGETVLLDDPISGLRSTIRASALSSPRIPLTTRSIF
jgi:hypothetical protein